MYKHQSSTVSHWALLINTGMYTNNTEYTQIDVCSMNVIHILVKHCTVYAEMLMVQ